MDIISFLILLIWLACGVLVIRFVVRTGGTRVGKVAHWFGGLFVMIGLAIGMTWVYAQLSADFGARVNIYLLTHQVPSGDVQTILEEPRLDGAIVVYRPGMINTEARRINGQLVIDEQKNVRISLWWMLWSKHARP